MLLCQRFNETNNMSTFACSKRIASQISRIEGNSRILVFHFYHVRQYLYAKEALEFSKEIELHNIILKLKRLIYYYSHRLINYLKFDLTLFLLN